LALGVIIQIMFIKVLTCTIVVLLSISLCMGQQNHANHGLRVVNRKIYFKGDNGSPLVTHLDSGPGDGIAWIEGRSFTIGTIEFDEKGKDVLQQSFVGIAYHGVNDSSFEVIYFRPFNFRSADPARKLHSVQYTAPPSYEWPVLRSEHPNQYEKPVIPEPDPNEWFHVKIEVTENKVSVFVNGNSVPALQVAPLVHSDGKMIGYWVGNGSDGDWKNLLIK
jgi:hypothetical protein